MPPMPRAIHLLQKTWCSRIGPPAQTAPAERHAHDSKHKSSELNRRVASPGTIPAGTGHYVSHALCVAAKLGIADLHGDGPRPYAELAQATGTHAPSLHRLLRLLASSGVLVEADAGTFSLTPVGECLRRGVAGSSWSVALLFAGPLTRSWNELLHSVQTGEVAFERVFGMKPFEYMAQHPDEAAIFNDAMTVVSSQTAKGVPVAYDFSAFQTVVDAGGGHGVLLAAILNANPGVSGILFELPQVAEGARKHIAELGLSERCDVVAGDFFERCRLVPMPTS